MVSRTKFDKLQSVVNYILLVSVLCTGMRLVPVIAIFFLSLLVADFIVLARQMPLTHVSRFRNLKRRLKERLLPNIVCSFHGYETVPEM